MPTLRPAIQIARKDLLRRFRDRTAILTAVILPFALAWIFSLTLAGVDAQTFEATYAVVDDDGGELAHALSETLAGVDGATVRAADEAEAGRQVEDGEIDAVFHLPAGFTDAVQSGRGATLDVTLSRGSLVAGLVADAIARSFAARLDAVSVAVASASGSAPMPPGGAEELAARAQMVPAAAEIADEGAEDRVSSTTTFFAIGMAVFFLFFAVEFGVRGLLEEREDGTLARLLVAPVPASAVLIGKAIASLAVGLVSTSLLVLATSLLLEADWGDPFGVALLVLAGVVAAVAVTALVSTFATTAAQAGAYASIVAVVGGLLGGTFFPIADAPGLFAAIRFLSPQGWLMEGFRSLASGEGLSGAVTAIAGTLVIAAVCAFFAWRRAWTMVAR